MNIGILALQGDVSEHIAVIQKIGHTSLLVKKPRDLQAVDGLIIPGGESTTITKLLKKSNLDKAIIERHTEGMPIYGTCAGAILLSKKIVGQDNAVLKLLDVTIARNDYGRQADSFETELYFNDRAIPAVFIRAPVISKVHNGAVVHATHNDQPVMIEDNNVLATTFHPELTDSTAVHRHFVKMAQEYNEVRTLQRSLED